MSERIFVEIDFLTFFIEDFLMKYSTRLNLFTLSKTLLIFWKYPPELKCYFPYKNLFMIPFGTVEIKSHLCFSFEERKRSQNNLWTLTCEEGF